MTTRRRLIARLGTGLGALLLGGCDRLSESAWFPRLLTGAEQWNRILQHTITGDALATEYSEADLSPIFPSNGTHRPIDPDYQQLAADNFRSWQLRIGGKVMHPASYSLDELHTLPARTQITRHDCVEGWSAIAKWKGVPLATLLDRSQPLPDARYVVFHCFDSMDPSGAKYYESVGFGDAYHPQTILAYAWNDRTLPICYGAPLRLRVERQLGYKMAKFISHIEVTDRLDNIAGGRGGYWEDRGYEWYAGI